MRFQFRMRKKSNLTVPAEPIKLKLVAINRELVFPGHHLLESLDGRVFKFDDLSTPCTDEMIVVIFIRDIIIQRPGITKMPLLRQSAVTEQIESPIDRGQTHPDIPLPDLSVQVLSRDMIFPKEDLQNELPLPGQF